MALTISETNTTISIAPNLPEVFAYESDLRSLFQNLISNAIKFRKKTEPCVITIHALKEKGFITFAISDNGIGIDKHDHQRIFEIFQRLHSRKEYEGTGIGLAHCKKIVDLHHGKIKIESELNKGTTFYISIPN